MRIKEALFKQYKCYILISMKFTSQICTTREQSERLLALGVKKETADCLIVRWDDEHTEVFQPNCGFLNTVNLKYATHIRAWSLHRLIEMMPNKIRRYDSTASLIVSNEKVQYYLHDVEYSDYLTSAGRWKSGNIYDNIIDCIEWLIKEGYFNKEYLEE